MLNTYTAIAVNPEAPFTDADGNAVSDVAVNTAGADALIQWLLSQEALDMAGEYGVAEYGEHLFYVKDNAPVYAGEIAPATEETKAINAAKFGNADLILVHSKSQEGRISIVFHLSFS